MITRVLFSCLLLLSLSACVASPHKVNEVEIENAATLIGFHELDKNGLDRVRVWVDAVDDKMVPKPLWSTFDVRALNDVQTLLVPGEHQVALAFKVNVTLHANCPCETTIIAFNATFQPNGAYRAMAERGYGFIDVWIEDVANKEPISPKFRFRPEPN